MEYRTGAESCLPGGKDAVGDVFTGQASGKVNSSNRGCCQNQNCQTVRKVFGPQAVRHANAYDARGTTGVFPPPDKGGKAGSRSRGIRRAGING
ncbi:hypothetical protein KAM448_13430 [Aeromonas caviae]|uniref:Uncharacterized protein n=1 Tax=Aeromonas caviae TaxID=648 RepID=A0AA37CV99_AERCA|nr:hypothetical protein KAM376_03090 [Aeromonas caviae]BDN94188.1 hypothetical protein KAM497c_37320 [Aeromonas caviae]GJA18609.1 hypothetical protein KAM336_16300 [Aeromonas caviae]GJA27058.1 hypothetical protein KAM340_12250 [Aeromonas caviae]GJA62669.1 hypothetical protein KAM351_12800 [Aeromonas caviae]